ncbi:MAG: hypothetical protein AAFW65_07370 [Pseudomonadota bacterium]
MSRIAFFASTLLIAGCSAAASGSQDGVGEYSLQQGESRVISFPAEESMLVTFGFEVGSPSWDATSDCPEFDVGVGDTPFMMPLCGALTDANGDAETGFGSSFRGQHGGGVSFSPKDGFIRVRLENLAHQEMAFQVKAEPRS